MRNNLRKQNGSLILFIAFVILPLIFLIFSLSLDISVYYTQSQKAQKTVDEAVMYGYKFLPSENDAKAAVSLFLNQNSESLGKDKPTDQNTLISVTPDSIGVQYSGSSPLTFASYFGLGSDLVALPYNAFSATRSTPLDAYLAVDTSSYMAPNVLTGTPWDEDGQWPAADYFRNIPVLDPNQNSISSPTTDKLMTEQCFNRVLSVQKYAAINIYDYLSSFKLNSIGLGFYPGYRLDLDTAREVLKPGERGPAYAEVAGQQYSGEASFYPAFGGLYQSDLSCMKAAEMEINHSEYRFPGISTKYKANITCSGSESMIDPITKSYNQDYQPCLTARDTIWTRAVYGNNNQNFPKVLELMTAALLGDGERKKERGGLLASVSKVGIVLAGDLPHYQTSTYPEDSVVKALDDEIKDIQAQVEAFNVNYSIYIILFSHTGINQTNFDNNVTNFKDDIDIYNSKKLNKGAFKIHLVVADNPATVVNQILPLILLQKRTVMISDKVV